MLGLNIGEETTMRHYRLKLVPNAAPNDDGYWVTAAVPKNINCYKVSPLATHHVVQVCALPTIQDGGPMHAQYLAAETVDYVFDRSWVTQN